MCLTNNLKINSPVPFRTSAFLRLRFQLFLPNGLLRRKRPGLLWLLLGML